MADRGPGIFGQRLTPREVQAIRCVAAGAKNRDIAARMGISYSTLIDYIRDSLRKLGAANRAAAVHAAHVGGWMWERQALPLAAGGWFWVSDAGSLRVEHLAAGWVRDGADVWGPIPAPRRR